MQMFLSIEIEKGFKEQLFQAFGGTDECISLVLRHLELVLKDNKMTNLTAITEPEKAIYLHIYDSLLGLGQLNNADDGYFADIGSGAGYPGIPLAVFSGRSGVLIEATQKKAIRLESYIKDLGLIEKLDVFKGRVEEFDLKSANGYSAICARAVGSLPELMELACPLLAINGILIAYKGPEGMKELDNIDNCLKILGMTISSTEEYLIPKIEAKRIIIVIRKVSEAGVRLPRRPGMARKRPLGLDKTEIG